MAAVQQGEGEWAWRIAPTSGSTARDVSDCVTSSIGLDGDSLATQVNEYWSGAGVLAHMAWWDARVIVLAEKIDRGEAWVPSDEEPEGDWLNDTTRLVSRNWRLRLLEQRGNWRCAWPS